jgi:predicted nucleic acid-binding protein
MESFGGHGESLTASVGWEAGFAGPQYSSHASRASIECDRVILRAAALGELTEAEAADRRAHLTAAASHWQILRVAPEIAERAWQPFPGEPVRTLDAIHLASALVARTAIAGLTLLSLDDRVRKAGKKLGLDVIPD